MKVTMMRGRHPVQVEVPDFTPVPEAKPKNARELAQSIREGQQKTEKSQIVILCFLFLALGILASFTGVLISSVALAVFGVPITLVGVAFAVLSLRE